MNGLTDAPNAIATVVSTRVMKPRVALAMAMIFNTIGALSGTAVATTIQKEIVSPAGLNLRTMAAAMITVIAWACMAWWRGWPISKSHALVASLAGAGLATGGAHVLLWVGWAKVFKGLFFSTIIGFGLGLVLTLIIKLLYRLMSFVAKTLNKDFDGFSTTKTHLAFKILQGLSAIFMAFNHGMNDGQKFIGVFTLTLILGGVLPHNAAIPYWVILLCAVVMGIGTAGGGWKIMHTMGKKIVHLQPWQGFAAETGASLSILIASRFGFPLSTTHTISTSIMGVGASKGMRNVRWNVAQKIVKAWVFTFPFCGVTAFLLSLLLQLL
jgi:PiT family inorganic phosphate transporter